MGRRLTLTDMLMSTLGTTEPIVDGHWEVGRLVLVPRYRADVAALKHCLFLALNFACEYAEVSHLYAACTHVLSRLYRRFGFQPFARDVPLRGTDKLYTLIRGTGAQVLQTLADQDAADAADRRRQACH